MIVASFASEAELMRAVARLQASGFGEIETYTPEEPSEDPVRAPSRIPLAILIAGVLGAGSMFLLQTYATVVDYPLDIGGHPDFSWPAYVPNAFEVGVLIAIVTGFVGFLAANRLPRLYDTIDESDVFRSPGAGEYHLALAPSDVAAALALLARLGPLAVEEVRA